MTQHSFTAAYTLPWRLPVGRALLLAMALLATIPGGCSRLRLPAIDSTGSCLFARKPTTTSLALPGTQHLQDFCNRLKSHHGGHLLSKDGKLGSCLTKRKHVFPTPAFPEPAPPPACPTPDQAHAGDDCNEPYVPSADCNGSCKDGPPAVLLGQECRLLKNHLPKSGKRGCILLSPQKIVAPVGGEVVLLSGICGTDGYLQMNERLEWMLTPDSVGTFIQVGDDDPGLLHRLAGSRVRPEKHDPSYARGITSTKRTLITRGNNDPRDDVQLEKGQTWITISSPSEGTSRVTVLAPDSECWDQRKATATIYWVDARWTFPGPQRVPAGQPVNLTTRVTRSEEAFPARGWKVRYEILNPELATIAGTAGGSVAEVVVDDSGNANVQLIPTPNTSGTAAINMTVIRPGGEADNLPDLTLGSGQTFVTWSSPQLAVRAAAPGVATYGVAVPVEVVVSNPGDQEATNVVVEAQLPPSTQASSTDGFAQVFPNAIVWEVGTIPPQMELPLTMNIATQSPIDLVFQARGDNGLLAEGRVRIDVFRPSLTVSVAPVQDRVETGQRVTFNVDVTNTGDRPLQNPALTATGDEGMIHEQGGRSVRTPPRQDGPLQPGETWGVEVVFIPTNSGRRCVTFEATADAGQRQTETSCVTVINPVPRTPRIEAVLQSPVSRIATGQSTYAQARIANTGQAAARNVDVTMIYDPQLQPVEATVGADQTRVGQNIISWTIPELAPGQEVKLEGVFNAIAVNPRARIAVNVRSPQAPQIDEEIFLEILDGTPPVGPAQPPALPPATPAPAIPGGPAPLQGAPPPAPPTTAAPQRPQRSEQLLMRLFLRDNPVRVNTPIRYSLQLVNDSSVRDGQVGIQFQLPNGVGLDRFVRTTSPEQTGPPSINAGIVSIPDITLMNPGESVEFEIVLRSNQPQVFDLNVLVRSQRNPAGITQSVQTTVVP